MHSRTLVRIGVLLSLIAVGCGRSSDDVATDTDDIVRRAPDSVYSDVHSTTTCRVVASLSGDPDVEGVPLRCRGSESGVGDGQPDGARARRSSGARRGVPEASRGHVQIGIEADADSARWLGKGELTNVTGKVKMVFDLPNAADVSCVVELGK